MNVADALPVTAGRHGDRTALKLDGDELGYRALDLASARVAGLLRDRGVGVGDRVAVMVPNVCEFAVVYYGVLRTGGVVVPLNPLLRRREVAFHLGDSGARLLFAWHAVAEEAEAGARSAGTQALFVTPVEFGRLLGTVAPDRTVRSRAGDDTAVILYTSGTTGTPKGAELTHANLTSNRDAVIRLHGLDEDEVTLGALPLYHSFGQTCALNATIAVGGMLSLIARFDARHALEIVARDRVTLFQGVPTMYSAMLAVPEDERGDTSSLRTCVSGGAAMPAELLRGFEAAFGCTILEGYGLSETSPVAASNRAAALRKVGSIGSPIEGVEMRVVGEDGAELAPGEVGEIVIRGPNVMKGYFRQPDATAEAIDAEGWFHSGDLGRVDEDGCFFIVDRKKDLIIRGGYNVYPREIEEVLHEHPAVREAAVVGLPDPELGEEVGAAVALHDGASATPDELRDFLRENVAAYKYPRRVWLVDELPKGPTGKILKREIARTPA